MRLLVIALIVFLYSFNYAHCGSRDSSSFLLMGIQGHYGFILPHSSAIRDISHTNPIGFEISRTKLHTSLDRWTVFNAYWLSGFQARYFNYQNPEIIGSTFDLTAFAEPVLSKGENYHLTIRSGIGFSYHTRVYDPEDNPLNLFFSSRISFPAFLDIRFKYKIGDQTFLTFTGAYNHISNGGFKKPNLGMNFPTIGLGLEYFQKPIPRLHDNYFEEARKERHHPFLIFQYLSTFKVYGSVDVPTKTTFVHGANFRFIKPLGPFYAINAGMEFFIDGYLKENLYRKGQDSDHKRFALTAGQDLMFGNVLFTQYFGVYLYSPAKPYDPIYQKYELAYRLHDNIMLGIFVKAHRHVAGLIGAHINLSIPARFQGIRQGGR